MKTIEIPSNNYKVEAENTAVKLIQLAYDGDRGALEVKAISAYLTAIADAINSDKDLNEIAIEEINRGELVAGAEVQVREVGVKYSYEDSEVWKRFNAKVKAATKERNDIQEEIQAATKSGKPRGLVDTDTGDMIMINPVAKSSTTKAIVSIK